MLRYILFFCLLPFTVQAQSVRTYIPPPAFKYADLISEEIRSNWTELIEIEYKGYVPSLIEHESCISLRHSRCWNPKSRLLTAREEGGGLGQLTRAYRPNGTLRFDSLKEMRRRYILELRELSWENLYTRPDLQIRALVLMSRDNYRKLADVLDDFERLAMTDAAYNGGYSDLLKERRLCGLTKGCDYMRWFGHVELTSVKSTRILYSNRSAIDINRHHVKDVLTIRLPKYQDGYFN